MLFSTKPQGQGQGALAQALQMIAALPRPQAQTGQNPAAKLGGLLSMMRQPPSASAMPSGQPLLSQIMREGATERRGAQERTREATEQQNVRNMLNGVLAYKEERGIPPGQEAPDEAWHESGNKHGVPTNRIQNWMERTRVEKRRQREPTRPVTTYGEDGVVSRTKLLTEKQIKEEHPEGVEGKPLTRKQKLEGALWDGTKKIDDLTEGQKLLLGVTPTTKSPIRKELNEFKAANPDWKGNVFDYLKQKKQAETVQKPDYMSDQKFFDTVYAEQLKQGYPEGEAGQIATGALTERRKRQLVRTFRDAGLSPDEIPMVFQQMGLIEGGGATAPAGDTPKPPTGTMPTADQESIPEEQPATQPPGENLTIGEAVTVLGQKLKEAGKPADAREIQKVVQFYFKPETKTIDRESFANAARELGIVADWAWDEIKGLAEAVKSVGDIRIPGTGRFRERVSPGAGGGF